MKKIAISIVLLFAVTSVAACASSKKADKAAETTPAADAPVVAPDAATDAAAPAADATAPAADATAPAAQ